MQTQRKPQKQKSQKGCSSKLYDWMTQNSRGSGAENKEELMTQSGLLTSPTQQCLCYCMDRCGCQLNWHTGLQRHWQKQEDECRGRQETHRTAFHHSAGQQSKYTTEATKELFRGKRWNNLDWSPSSWAALGSLRTKLQAETTQHERAEGGCSEVLGECLLLKSVAQRLKDFPWNIKPDDFFFLTLHDRLSDNLQTLFMMREKDFFSFRLVAILMWTPWKWRRDWHNIWNLCQYIISNGLCSSTEP